MTNYERIKAMSVDEMAVFLIDNEHDCQQCRFIEQCVSDWVISCEKRFKDWLLSESEVDT